MNSALIIVDVWEGNVGIWRDRAKEAALKINAFLKKFRGVGLVIHSPCGVNGWIEAPENKRIRERTNAVGFKHTCCPCSKEELNRVIGKLPRLAIPERGGIDRIRQHPLIEIDQERDYLTVDPRIVLKLLEDEGIKNLFYAGGATNVCLLYSSSVSVLNIKGNLGATEIFLVTDLSITFFDEEKARSVIGERDVEEFMFDFYRREVCPTVTSEEVLSRLQ